ncbi:hypothetical protein EMPS_07340 [Entomortierella parvispora]|uniref:PA14 domain-containing protein n=1 Tax=Entomortierella parvispora TaxID=205924 RepID=A0A9P3HE60_9FUNG|nr:hypothetical protein EMPS_07340 [Entomortierella parvispora]
MLGTTAAQADFQARPWSSFDTTGANHEDLVAAQPPLRTKASSTSIASDTSTGSDTTFLSTLSFSTTTGAHFRTQTQEELFRNGGVDAGADDEQGDNEDGGYDQDEDAESLDLDTLEVAILTPREKMRIITPGDHLSLTQPLHRRQESHSRDPFFPIDEMAQEEGEEQYSSLKSLSFSPTSKRHTKSSSQHSTDRDTIKGYHSIDASLSSLSKDISFKSRRLRSDRQQNSQDTKLAQKYEQELSHRSVEDWRESHREASDGADDVAEEEDHQPTDMQLASPDYRKSMAPSLQSDVATDHLSSPTKGRGSSVYLTSETPYTNLLRDATLIIEQQQQRQPGPSTWIRGDHGSDEGSSTAPSRDPKAQASESNQRGAVGIAPLDSTGSATKERTSAPSNRSTPKRSRSRRFSAPGNQFSSQSSLSSLSQSTRAGAAGGLKMSSDKQPKDEDIQKTQARAPQALSEYETRLPRDPSGGGDSDGDDCGGANQQSKAAGSSKHATNLYPLQHHPTMQASVNATLTTTTTDGLVPPSLHLNNQLQQRHDFRQGVVFEYYEGEWDWLPNFDEMRPLHAGIVGNFMIDDTTECDLFRPQGQEFMGASRQGNNNRSRPAKESGNFAVRFTTHIDITQDGVYSFWLSSNDGSVLYIENNLVVENDGMHYATEVEGRVLLQAGKHAMTVEFFHKNGKMLEGFRSTGPSLVVSYRKPGPVWSFGLAAGPKRVIKSSNLFYDHGDARLRNLLNEFGVDSMDRHSQGQMSPLSYRDPSSDGRSWHKEMNNSNHGYGQDLRSPDQLQTSGNGGRVPARHRVMSGDMGQMQPSTRELLVQMENAKTTIKDLEKIIQDQAETHKKKMSDLYDILQDTQAQVDRFKTGLKQATLFEKPKTTIHPSHTSNPAWRNSVVSIYVDAEEDHPLKFGQEGAEDAEEGSDGEADNTEAANAIGGEGDLLLEKHLQDLEKLKQMYFFSMALSVKMNCEMMASSKVGVTGAAALSTAASSQGASPEYTSTSVQKLYEDCTFLHKIPVEGWPGFVSRHFASRGRYNRT